MIAKVLCSVCVAGVILTGMPFARAGALLEEKAEAAFVAATSAPQQKAAFRFVVVASEHNKARYRVRERLAGRELDNDAIGETPNVTGTIAVDDKGKVIASESRFTAELAPLTSDNSRRDNYVRRRLLVTDTFPTTTLNITDVRGLPSPLPEAGEAKFQIIGNLTLRGVTRQTTWSVTAKLEGDRLSGTAATRFAFADFSIPQPRVAMVLSVSDTIGLEYDFVMTRK